MAWYLNRALTNLRAEVDATWPNRDRTSDGTIGDLAHQSTDSDHNPDPDGSVDAWDMDVDGVDVEHVKEQFEKHEAAQYWIHNGKIASRSYGVTSAGRWVQKPYTGPNPHDKHVHFNTRSSYENSSKPWGIGDDYMPSADEVAAAVWSANWPDNEPQDLGGGRDTAGWRAKYVLDIVKNNQQRINTVTANVTAVDGKVAAVDAKVVALDAKVEQALALLEQLAAEPTTG